MRCGVQCILLSSGAVPDGHRIKTCDAGVLLKPSGFHPKSL